MSGQRWPLHPQPREWEGLETWVRRIAEAYGVGYDTFLHHALGRTGRGARELDGVSGTELAALSAGTGVSVKRLREMTTGATMARMSERIREWLLTEEGQEALGQLRVSLMRTTRRAEAASRGQERRHAIPE